LGTRWRRHRAWQLGWHEADDVPDMRLGLALGADGSDGFCPFDGGTLDCRASSAAGQLRLNSAIRATSASIRATSAAIKAVLRANQAAVSPEG